MTDGFVRSTGDEGEKKYSLGFRDLMKNKQKEYKRSKYRYCDDCKICICEDCANNNKFFDTTTQKQIEMGNFENDKLSQLTVE